MNTDDLICKRIRPLSAVAESGLPNSAENGETIGRRNEIRKGLDRFEIRLFLDDPCSADTKDTRCEMRLFCLKEEERFEGFDES